MNWRLPTLPAKAKPFVMLFIAGVLTGSTLVAVFTRIHWFSIDSCSNTVEMLTMIGTVGATISALVFGLSGLWKSRKEARTKAVLIASGILPGLIFALDDLKCAIGVWDFTEVEKRPKFVTEDPSKNFLLMGVMQLFIKATEHETWNISLDTLAALTPIHKNAAHRIAKALGLIANAKKMQLDDEMSTQRMVASLNGVHARLQEAVSLLEVATEAMTAEVRAANLDPTLEELFGDWEPTEWD